MNKITYHYCRYQREYSKQFDSIKEAVEYAVQEESNGSLSSTSILDCDTVVWDRSDKETTNVFALARKLGFEID